MGSSALSDDLTQHVERLVSRRKSRIGSYLEQCLTQLVHGPAEVQRAAQVRLELLVVSGGGEGIVRLSCKKYEMVIFDKASGAHDEIH